MLPTSRIVESVLRDCGVLEAARDGSVIIDMGSSEPTSTRDLAAEAAGRGVDFVDAPVSGGVAGAENGTLTIMVGGDRTATAACEPLLATLGSRIVHVGRTGAGHAVKALNNLLSATSLLATSEAVRIGRAFGIEPQVLIDAVNTSSGRSGSTERKFPDFILSETYASGFPLKLMVKDIKIALGLGDTLGVPAELGHTTAQVWERAAAELTPDADHTELARWIDGDR
jgi:3-hydroxyisobutyrate dehydrogenase